MARRLFVAGRLMWTSALGVACQGGPPPAEPPFCAPGALWEDGLCLPASCGAAPWEGAEVAAWVDARSDGDGSEEAPFAHIQDGLDAAAAAGGGLVAVRPGTYAENLALAEEHVGLTLAGRCSAAVVVEASDDAPALAAELPRLGDGAAVSGLTLKGGDFGLEHAQGALAVSDLRVTEARGVGVMVGIWNTSRSATLAVDGLVIEGAKRVHDAGYTNLGMGLIAGEGTGVTGQDLEISAVEAYGLWGVLADVDLEGVTIAGAAGIGVAATSGADLWLDDLAVSEITDDTDVSGAGGIGLYVESSSNLEVTGFDVHDTSWIGVFLDGTYGEVTASLRQGTVQDATFMGLWTYLGTLEMEDVEVGDVASDTHGDGGTTPLGAVVWTGTLKVRGSTFALNGGGLQATHDSVVTLENSRFEPRQGDARNICVQVDDTNLTVSATSFTGCSPGGILAEFSTVALNRVQVTGSGYGVLDDGFYKVYAPIQLDGTQFSAVDTQIFSSTAVGILAENWAQLDLTHVLVSGVADTDASSLGVGITVQSNATLDATDLAVEDIAGVGLFVAAGEATCTSCVFSRAIFAGAALVDAGELSLVDTAIADVAHTGGDGGVGVYVEGQQVGAGSTVRLSVVDSSVEDVELVGVYLSGPGLYEIRDSLVEGGSAARAGSAPSANGVFATDGIEAWTEGGDAGLLLEGDLLRGGEGGALFLHQSTATLRDLSFESVETTVVQTGCEGLEPPEGAEGLEGTDLCPRDYDLPVEPLEWRLYTITSDVEG